MPTGSRSMATKYSHWIIAAPTIPSTASWGRWRTGTRRRRWATGPTSTSRPTATPVQRSAASWRGSTPASSATFETLALSPNSTAAAVTWARPRPGRVAGPAAAGAVVAGAVVTTPRLAAPAAPARLGCRRSDPLRPRRCAEPRGWTSPSWHRPMPSSHCGAWSGATAGCSPGWARTSRPTTSPTAGRRLVADRARGRRGVGHRGRRPRARRRPHRRLAGPRPGRRRSRGPPQAGGRDGLRARAARPSWVSRPTRRPTASSPPRPATGAAPAWSRAPTAPSPRSTWPAWRSRPASPTSGGPRRCSDAVRRTPREHG